MSRKTRIAQAARLFDKACDAASRGRVTALRRYLAQITDHLQDVTLDAAAKKAEASARQVAEASAERRTA